MYPLKYKESLYYCLLLWFTINICNNKEPNLNTSNLWKKVFMMLQDKNADVQGSFHIKVAVPPWTKSGFNINLFIHFSCLFEDLTSSLCCFVHSPSCRVIWSPGELWCLSFYHYFCLRVRQMQSSCLLLHTAKENCSQPGPFITHVPRQSVLWWAVPFAAPLHPYIQFLPTVMQGARANKTLGFSQFVWTKRGDLGPTATLTETCAKCLWAKLTQQTHTL